MIAVRSSGLAACWVVLSSGLFAVRHVVVVGAGRVTKSEIGTVARAAMGDSMLTVNTSSLRQRVSTLPTISSVRVSRVWPNTLRITVSQRQAVLAVMQPTGWLLVDRTGVPYLTVSQLPAHVLPLTVSTPTGNDPAVRAAVAVVVALPAQVQRRVVAVVAPSPAGIRLRLSGGATVVWGGAEDSTRKARALAALLHRHARVYDVSTPGFVTTS